MSRFIFPVVFFLYDSVFVLLDLAETKSPSQIKITTTATTTTTAAAVIIIKTRTKARARRSLRWWRLKKEKERKKEGRKEIREKSQVLQRKKRHRASPYVALRCVALAVPGRLLLSFLPPSLPLYQRVIVRLRSPSSLPYRVLSLSLLYGMHVSRVYVWCSTVHHPHFPYSNSLNSNMAVSFIQAPKQQQHHGGCKLAG